MSRRDNPNKNYTPVPNSIIHNPNLTPEAMGVLIYLYSVHRACPDWKIYPSQIQKKFGFGDRVWRTISKCLREEGYLTIENGAGRHGKWISLCKIDEKSPPVDNSKPVDKSVDKLCTTSEKPVGQPFKVNRSFSTVENQPLKMNAYILNKHIHKNEHILKKHKHTGPRPYVDAILKNELGDMLLKWGVYPQTAISWINEFGFDIIYHEIGKLKEQNENKRIRSWGSSLGASLKRRALEMASNSTLEEISYG